MNKRMWCMLLVFGLVWVAVPADALVGGSAIRKMVSELVELIARKSPGAADDLAKLGGEKALKELTEQIAETAGEKGLKQLQGLVAEHGVSAVKALKTNPGRLLQALDHIPASLQKQAISALNYSPDVLNRLIATYGPDALLAAVKHPGIGTEVMEKLGREGMEAALKLEKRDLMRLHRLSPNLSQLEAARRSPVMDMLLKAPERTLSLLERHPNVLMTAAGVAVLINYRDALLGGSDRVQNPDGTWEVTSRPGMLERTVGKFLESEPVKTGIILIFSVLGLIIFMRGLISMWAAVQRQRMNQRKIRSSTVPPEENASGNPC